MALTFDEQTVPRVSELAYRLACARAARLPLQPLFFKEPDDRATPEGIPPERLKLVSAGIQHLSAIIGQLVDARNEAESDEYGTLQASEPAYQRACNLLVDAAIVAAQEGRQIPHGCVSTDSEGGIRTEWVRPDSSVHLVIPASADRDGYIYHEVGKDYATESATAEALAHWLRVLG